MLSVLPAAQRRTEDPPTLVTLDEVGLLNIADPWRRSRLADELAQHLQTLADIALRIRCEAIRELVHQHKASHATVARHLGVTRSRIGQLVTRPSGALESKAVTA